MKGPTDVEHYLPVHDFGICQNSISRWLCRLDQIVSHDERKIKYIDRQLPMILILLQIFMSIPEELF